MASLQSRQPRLQVQKASGEESTLSLGERTLSVGRRSDNDLQVNDPHISRYHAEFVPSEGAWLLKDLQSKEGTYVNGEKVDQHELRDGDVITLGRNRSLRLTFLQGNREDSTGLQLEDLQSATREDYQALMMLLELTKALNSSLVLGDVLGMVIDGVLQVTGAERGFLMLRNPRGNLEFSIARNFKSENMDSETYEISQSVVEKVVESGVPEILVNVQDDQRFKNQQSILALELKTILCVPLILHHAPTSEDKERILGVIYVDNKSRSKDFSKKGLRLLESLASHAAIAIENARLHQEALEKKRIEEEIKVARIIQQRLLPKDPPAVPFLSIAAMSQPTRSVGGDYYNYIELEDNRLGFVVGDVSGKGIPAALLMSLLDGIFSAQAEFGAAANSTVSRVNDYLHKKSSAEKFVTLFYGILSQDGTLRFTNAGHDPPFLIRGDGSVDRLRDGGLILGAFPGMPYDEGCTKMNPGDTVILFTDGISEARNRQGKEFSEEKLLQLAVENRQLPAAELQACIQDALEAFTEGAPQHDDITLFVLQYTGRDENGELSSETPGAS